MCTVIIIARAFPDYPLVIAHNRDEMLDRPWSGPRSFGHDPIIVAPRDESAGGTWIGLNDAGLVVTITNRMWRTTGEPPSRGLLCQHALECSNVSAARARVEAGVATAPHHGFNLLLADRERVVLLQCGAEGLTTTELEAGTHLLTSLHDLNPPLLAELRQTAQQAVSAAPNLATLEAGLLPVMRDHRKFDPLYSVCKHGETYGTRSAALIALAADGGAVLRFANGQPCEQPLATVALPFGEAAP